MTHCSAMGCSGSLVNEGCTAEFQVEANPAFPVSTAWSSRIPGSSLPDTRQGEARDGNQAWVIEEESLESLFCYQMGIIPQGVKLEEDPCSAG